MDELVKAVEGYRGEMVRAMCELIERKAISPDVGGRG